MIPPFESSNGTDVTGTMLDGQRWFPVINTEAEAVPPFSVVEIFDGENDGLIFAKIRKPTGASGAILALTGPLKIAAYSSGTPAVRATGMATRDGPAWMAFQGADPANGDTYGGAEDSWLGDESGSDFTVIGPVVNNNSGTPSDDDVKRVLVILSASAPQSIQVGTVGARVSDGVYWINLYDFPGSPWRLTPDGNGTLSSWKDIAGSGSAAASMINKDPDNPDDGTAISCNVANNSSFFTLSNTPSFFDQAQTCGFTGRFKKSSGSTMELAVRITKADQTTALTNWATISPATSFGNVTAALSLIGDKSKTSWDGARLQFATGSGSGTVYCSAAYAKVGFTTTDFTMGPTGLMDTGKKIKAYARVGDFTDPISSIWAYVTKFKWGYEIINSNCAN